MTNSCFLCLRWVNVKLQLRIQFEFGRCLLLQGKSARNFHLIGRITDAGAVGWETRREGHGGAQKEHSVSASISSGCETSGQRRSSLHVVFGLEPLGLN